MPRPICLNCACEMVVAQNDFPVKDAKITTSTGTVFASTVWFGDMMECPKCHIRIITGFGNPVPKPEDWVHKALSFSME